MARANLRKVGGSVMLAIPPAILDQLSFAEGAGVELSVEGEALVVRSRRPRYTLDQLLAEEEAGQRAKNEADRDILACKVPEPVDDWQSDAAAGEELI